MSQFSLKEQLRFRKLLEIANSSTFPGERDAALAAATRMAAAHDMTLREAAGMPDRDEPPLRSRRRMTGFPSDFGAAVRAAGINRDFRTGRVHGRQAERAFYTDDAAQQADEKRRYEAAMADAVRRGLGAEERAAALKKRNHIHRPNRRAYRNRTEFVRILLKETAMSAREIAATVGVTIYDVFREKLLMRRRKAAG